MYDLGNDISLKKVKDDHEKITMEHSAHPSLDRSLRMARETTARRIAKFATGHFLLHPTAHIMVGRTDPADIVNRSPDLSVIRIICISLSVIPTTMIIYGAPWVRQPGLIHGSAQHISCNCNLGHFQFVGPQV